MRTKGKWQRDGKIIYVQYGNEHPFAAMASFSYWNSADQANTDAELAKAALNVADELEKIGIDGEKAIKALDKIIAFLYHICNNKDLDPYGYVVYTSKAFLSQLRLEKPIHICSDPNSPCDYDCMTGKDEKKVKEDE